MKSEVESISHHNHSKSANNNIYYKKSKKISSRLFREMFKFEENDRHKKQIKKDYKEIEQINGKVKFKHLIGNNKLLIIQISIWHRVTTSVTHWRQLMQEL